MVEDIKFVDEGEEREKLLRITALMATKLDGSINICQWIDYDLMTPSFVVYCLIHEDLHLAIYKLEGYEVSKKLDSLRGLVSDFAIAVGVPTLDVAI